MEEKGNARNGEGSKPSSEDRLGTVLKGAACLAFLIISIFLWLKSGRSWLVLLLLLLPSYACQEWLSGKIFIERSRWSTAESGFSVLRIIYGVILTLLFFGAIYGLTLLARWLF